MWGRLWAETFGPILSDAGLTARQANAVYLMVLQRLVDPGSKCAALRFADDVYGAPFDGLELHDLYRSLDVLAETKEAIEASWFARQRDLITDTDLLYFDTTSTYVEGSHPEELATFGYSRDHRGDRRQVGLGVVLTREGLPVAHIILPGNTADPAAFRVAIDYLQKSLGVSRMILCCDRGWCRRRTSRRCEMRGYPTWWRRSCGETRQRKRFSVNRGVTTSLPATSK